MLRLSNEERDFDFTMFYEVEVIIIKLMAIKDGLFPLA